MSIQVELVEQLFSQYKNEPIGFCKDVLNIDLIWSGQKKVFDAYNEYKRVAIPSGHSTGKTGSEAMIILHWLSCRKNSRVICTAPTYRQLQHVLYAEIHKWYNKSELKILELFRLKHGIMHINDEEYKKMWYMLPISPKSPDSLQGQHGDKSELVKTIMKELGVTEINDDDTIETVVKKLKDASSEGDEEDLLIILEEASGIPQEILEVLEGTDYGKLLMFGNMTKNTGMFYDAVYRSGGKFEVVRLSSYDSPFMSYEQIKYMEDRYGKDSNVVKVRLKGEAPDSEDDTVLSRSAVEALIDYEVDETKIPSKFIIKDETIFLGQDIARFGDDTSQLYERYKYYIKNLYSLSKKDTMRSVGEVSRLVKNNPDQYYEVRIDGIGVGGGVIDRLRELSYPNLWVYEFHNNEAADSAEEYVNKITEGYFEIKERVDNKAISFPDDPELIEDLCGRKYGFDSKGRLVIESKEEFKKRFKRSPDKGDAFIQAWKNVYRLKFYDDI